MDHQGSVIGSPRAPVLGRVSRRLGGTAPLSAMAVVARGLTSFILVWQALWMLSDVGLWPTRQADLVAELLIVGSLCTWGALLLTQLEGTLQSRRWARNAAVSTALITALELLRQAETPSSAGWAAATQMGIVAVGMAGLLWDVPASLVGIGLVVGLEVLAVTQMLTADADVPVVLSDLLYPAYAAAIGIVTIWARMLIVRDARRADAAALDVGRAEREAQVAEGVEFAVRSQERLLHETVLNTLTAIDRGGLTTSPSMHTRLVERCRESARTLSDLRARTEEGLGAASALQQLEDDLGGPAIDLYLAGVSLQVDCDPLGELPPQVYAAIRTAVREALSNVVRHARAHRAWVTARIETDGVRVEVGDDGVGFATRARYEDRYGIGGSVTGPMADVGGEAEVVSRPGYGTAVRLRWRVQEATNVPRLRPWASGFAFPILATFGAYTAAAFLVSLPDVADPRGDLIAFLLFVALAILVVWGSRRPHLPAWIVAVVAGLSPLVYQLQAHSLGAGGGGQWGDWASGAIAALFLALAAVGPSWAWIAVLSSWLLIQGDVLAELTSPGTAVILSGAIFGRSTRRNAAAYEKARSEELAEHTRLTVARESLHRVQRRYGVLRESSAVELLEGIADGRLDPDDAVVRDRAALEERFIRTVIRVDPSADSVRALATALAVEARRRGLYLDIDLSGAPAAHSPELHGSRSSLLRAVACSVPGEVARLTARSEGDAFVIRLLTPITPGDRNEMLQLDVPGVVADPFDTQDAHMLWEVREQAEVTG